MRTRARHLSLAFLAFWPFLGGPLATLPLTGGLVVDSAGRPVAGAELVLADGSDNPRPLTLSDRDGHFRLWVPNGREIAVEIRHPAFVTEVASLQAGSSSLTTRLVLYRGGVIRGRLTNALGQPILRARVEARQGATSLVGIEVGRDGSFLFEALPVAARLSLSVEADGFARASRSWQMESGVNELGDWVLEESRPFRRQVVGQDGEPIAGADVYLLDPHSPQTENLELMPAGEKLASTDDAGFFEITDLPAKIERTLQIRAPGHIPVAISSPRLDLIADPVELLASPVVQGLVRDEDGPVAGAVVILAPADPDKPAFFGSETRTSKSGRFELEPVSGGRRRLLVDSAFHLPQELWLDLPPEGITHVEVNLSRGLALAGRVLGVDRKPVSGALVQWISSTGKKGRADEVTDARGGFRLDTLPAGPGKLFASHPQLGEMALELDLQQEIENLEIQLAIGVRGSFVVRVVDSGGAPLPGAKVELWPESTGALKSATTGEDGVAKIAEVGPGAYRIVAGLEGYVGDGLLSEEANRPVEVTLRLEKACKVVGEILGSRPEELAVLRIYATRESDRFRGGRINPNRGIFEIPGLSTGAWTVVLIRPGGEKIERQIVLNAPGDSEALSFTL